MTPKTVYLDSSALVKLVFAESESPALRAFLGEQRSRVSSALARTEVGRVVNRLGRSEDAKARAGDVLDRTALIALDNGILLRAGEVGPAQLRTLDAVHLATALSLGDDLGGIVTYDRRLADAAHRAGLTVWSPR